MKRLQLIFLLLLFGALSSRGQNCNLIQNPGFNNTYSHTPSYNPYANSWVPYWLDICQTPQTTDLDYIDGPSAALFWAQDTALTTNAPEVIGQCLSQHLDKGKKYFLSVHSKLDTISKYDKGTIQVHFFECKDLDTVRNGCCPYYTNLISFPHQTVLNDSVIDSTNWKLSTACFIANKSWTGIVINPFTKGSLDYWLDADDIELYQVKPYAGKDTTICSGTVATIGKPNCSGPRPPESYKWYKLPGYVLIDTIPQTLVSPTITTTYVLVHEIGGCMPDSDTVIVFIHSIKPIGGRDTLVCPNVFPISMAVNTGFIHYSWSNGDTTNLLTANSVGTYIVIVMDSFGCTGSDTINITLKALPINNLGASKHSCCGACVNLNAVFDSTYRYRWSTGDTTDTVKVCITGYYNCIVTNALDCSDSDTVFVKILPKLTPWDTGICHPYTFPITHTIKGGYTTYSWSSLRGSPFTSTDSTLNAGDTGTFIVEATDSFGCTCRDTIRIYYKVKPFTISDTTICEHDVITKCGPGPAAAYLYAWSNGATTQCITISDPGGTYSLTVTDTSAHPCSETATFVVNVIHLTVSGGTYGPYCEDDPAVTLTGSPAGGTFSGTGISGGMTFTPSIAGPGRHHITYTYTMTSLPYCTAQDTFSIFVCPKLQPLSGKRIICKNDPAFDVTANLSGGVWNVSPGTSFAPFIGGSNILTIIPSGCSVGTHTLTYTITNACGCSYTDTFTFKIRDYIIGSIAAGPFVPCEDSVLLTATAYYNTGTTLLTTPMNYYWSDGALGQTRLAWHSGFYTCYFTSDSACPDSATIYVNLCPKPLHHNMIHGPRKICLPSPNIRFWDDTLGGFTHLRGFSLGSATPPNGPTEEWIDPNVLGPGHYILTFTETSACGCTLTDTFSFVIQNQITSVILQSPYLPCEDSVVLTASGSYFDYLGFPQTLPMNYVWADGYIGQTRTVYASGCYTCFMTSDSACQNSGTICITLCPKPRHAQITNPPPPLCLYDAPYILTADTLVNWDTLWVTPTSFLSNVSSSVASIDPAAYGPGVHRIFYKTVTACGCILEDYIDVTIFDTVHGTIVNSPLPQCDDGHTMNVTLTASGYYDDVINGIPYSTAGIQCQWLYDGHFGPTAVIHNNGTYKVVMSSSMVSIYGLLVCPDTVEIVINVPSCCNQLPVHNWMNIYSGQDTTISGMQVWTDTIYIEGRLHITNAQMIMKNCAIIIVGRGGFLDIQNSHLGLCSEGWRGIEVWGYTQSCPRDTHYQGHLVMKNSEIDYAEIAVFAGARRYLRLAPHNNLHGIGPTFYAKNPRMTLGGGIIDIYSDTFFKNYVDVMFQEYNFDAICTSQHCDDACDGCPHFGANHYWQSHVESNYFDTSAINEYCSQWVNDTLAYYQNVWDTSSLNLIPWSTPLPQLSHIVDFNLNPWVWSALFCKTNIANCCYFKNASNAAFPSGSIFNNNTYIIQSIWQYVPSLQYYP